MIICKNCLIEFVPKDRRGIFCSKNCSAKYTNARKDWSKIKTGPPSKTIKKSRKPLIIKYTKINGIKTYGEYICHSCNNSFLRLKYQVKCCSIECRDNIRSKNKCLKRRLPYFNKNDNLTIELQSNWEIIIAEWLDLNNIRWSQPSNRFSWYDVILNKNRTYLPDFYLIDYNCYLDVKNPIKQKQDESKISQLIKMLPLYVGDIEYIKNMVKNMVKNLALQTGVEPACFH
jgi:hypothetical protein